MSMIQRAFPSPVRITCLALASALLGCGGGEGGGPAGGGSGGGGPGDDGGSAGTTTTTQPGGTCTEDALFEPRSFGEDGTDLIRRIELESGTGDLIFSVLAELYRLPSGGDTPELLLPRPAGAQPLYGAFWLVDGDILLPAAPGIGALITAANPGGMMDQVPVLYQARAGGEPSLVVSELMPSEELVFYEIAGARVVEDDVFWVDARVERESFSTGAPLDRTYRAWYTSWRSPAEPVQLYTSDFELEVPVVVDGIAYIEEANGETAQDGTTQRMITLADGSVGSSSAEELYGGKVIAGDDQSLIVNNEIISLDNLEDYGLYRYALDGSQEERLYQGLTTLDWRSRDGAWAYDVYNIEADTHDIYVFQPGSAPRLVGCVADSSNTVHDVVLGPDAVYVSVFYTDFTATILRYPR